MLEALILDTSPLLFFHRIHRLPLLPQLARQLLIPQAVLEELRVQDSEDQVIAAVHALPQTQFEAIYPVPGEVTSWSLGPGETQVLSLALSRPKAVAVLDDRAARRRASELGLNSMGTVGLLTQAKVDGHIQRVKPLLLQMLDAGLWLAPRTLELILQQLEED